MPFFDNRTQSYGSLTAVVLIPTDTYWTRTDSRSVVGSLGDATTVLKCLKLSYCSRGFHLIRTAVLLQSYCNRTGSYWLVLMRTDAYGNPTQSRRLVLQSYCSRAQSYWFVLIRTAILLSRVD